MNTIIPSKVSSKTLNSPKHAMDVMNDRRSGLRMRDSSVGFFKVKSKTSFARSSLMDAFITVVKPEKSVDDIATLHEHRESELRELVAARKHVLICGGTGVGKSFVLERALDASTVVRLEPEHLKSKHNSLIDFLRDSEKTIVIEDYDGEAYYKDVIERAIDGKSITKGSLIVTSREYHLWGDAFTILHIPPHTPEALVRLIPDRAAAERAGGSVRDFFSYARDKSDAKDVFKTPKELVYDMLSSGEYPRDLESVSEHGHMFSIVQENYPDSRDARYAKIAFSFSDADIFDDAMYRTGNWGTMPFFIHSALEYPVRCLGEPLNRDTLRSGSFWTKDGNARMRYQRVRQIAHACAPLRVDVDALCLLHTYAGLKMYDRLIAYNIRASMFDVMNHLRMGAENKLKQKSVSIVKRALKQHYELDE